MMSFSTWLTFFLLMTPIAYTPGPMTMFSMSSSVRNGFYHTLPAIAGGSFAYLTQMAVVYLGLDVIVQKSMLVFNTIKWAGVVYLFILPSKTGVSHPKAAVSRTQFLTYRRPGSFLWDSARTCPTLNQCLCSRFCSPSLLIRLTTKTISSRFPSASF